MLKDGQSQRIVTRKVSIPQYCVGNAVKKSEIDARLTNVPGQARKQLSMERADQRLLQISIADRTKSRRRLPLELTLSNGAQLSTRTIRRRLLDAE